MKILLFVLGALCWLDWLPFISINQLDFVHYFSFIFLLIVLLKEKKFDLKLNFNLKKVLIAYFLLILFSSFLNGVFPKSSLLISLMIVMIILSIKKIKKNHFINGFFFGGIITIFYMYLLKNNFIIVDYYELREALDISKYSSENLNEVVALGLTNKNNKLSYLFSISTALILFSKQFNRLLMFSIVVLILYFQVISGGAGGLIATVFILITYFLPKHRKIRRFLIFILGLILFLFLLFKFQDFSFLFYNESGLSRLNQYYFSFYENYNVIFGNGYVSDVELINAAYIHNFFLNNYYAGGIVGLIFSIIVVYILIKKIKSSGMNENFKIYMIFLLIIQCIIENNNILTTIGSYLVFWILLVPDIFINQKKTK